MAARLRTATGFPPFASAHSSTLFRNALGRGSNPGWAGRKKCCLLYAPFHPRLYFLFVQRLPVQLKFFCVRIVEFFYNERSGIL